MSQGRGSGMGEELGLFLLLAVIVFHKCQLWDQDSCMSDLLVLCVQGGRAGNQWGTRETGKGRRRNRDMV